MAEGWGPDAADIALAAICLGVAGALSEVWLQLHVGPPGAAGTSNVAVNNTRVELTGSLERLASGQIDNSLEVDQSASAPATETYTHWSLWSASSGGTFALSGLIAGDASVSTGDPVKFAAHTLVVSVPLAS